MPNLIRCAKNKRTTASSGETSVSPSIRFVLRAIWLFVLFLAFRRKPVEEKTIMESLILAQNERWRRVLNMQVERSVAIQGVADG